MNKTDKQVLDYLRKASNILNRAKDLGYFDLDSLNDPELSIMEVAKMIQLQELNKPVREK